MAVAAQVKQLKPANAPSNEALPRRRINELKTLHQAQRPGYFDGLSLNQERTGNVQLNRE